ncbi:MAG: hypothetical protein JWN78_338 [Bacteroidota bacterium]|nr:hypothetical protein [Bacteroidota bacterium]
MTIKLSEYNPNWASMFFSEKQLVLKNFPVKESLIEHIGSTAIPSLIAKPIIDILLGVPSLSTEISVVNYLEKLNYEYIEEYNKIIPERRFFIKNINSIRTYHIHMTEINSDFWIRHLFFRNQLLENIKVREQYQELKIKLTKQEWDSGNSYANAKSDFIRSVENKNKRNN